MTLQRWMWLNKAHGDESFYVILSVASDGSVMLDETLELVRTHDPRLNKGKKYQARVSSCEDSETDDDKGYNSEGYEGINTAHDDEPLKSLNHCCRMGTTGNQEFLLQSATQTTLPSNLASIEDCRDNNINDTSDSPHLSLQPRPILTSGLSKTRNEDVSEPRTYKPDGVATSTSTLLAFHQPTVVEKVQPTARSLSEINAAI
ncbi:uncharacterized protein BDR25DRAFT_317994 [Lindgomyces ingoldianus]|uniref:Uncharacterized protein n=1 Tax=Lindgomyces ingoldianus TaxID=673940 RepID=A0ACB6QG18_9PLEO|nr:uncharacterized protein BDR25DRAFT_317994 [Lindgomyces ingoldianus]KAF2465836.1 hypothetical protein BDR25DRAFT_317994 [Lindgomyces ingoldianus]